MEHKKLVEMEKWLSSRIRFSHEVTTGCCHGREPNAIRLIISRGALAQWHSICELWPLEGPNKLINHPSLWQNPGKQKQRVR